MRESERDDRGEPFGMPFTNREVAVIVANDLNRHDRSLWFYEVERHIDDKRWIIARKAANAARSCSCVRAPRNRPYGAGYYGSPN